MALKLGKSPPRFDSRTLLFKKYLTQRLAPPPPSANFAKAVKKWPMYGNDHYGDCTCAAAGHMIQEWLANTHSMKRPPSEHTILEVYNHFVHGQADEGVPMLDALRYWRNTGIGGDKIHAFSQLELKDIAQAQDAIYLFGNCYIGLALPDFVVPGGVGKPDVPWIVPPSGPKGNAASNSKNGHCVPAVAYDRRSLWVVTWGILKQMTWQFYTAYADEAFAVLSLNWLNKGHRAPPGFDLKTLESDLSRVAKV